MISSETVYTMVSNLSLVYIMSKGIYLELLFFKDFPSFILDLITIFKT